jgi:hypothetical protein
MTRQRATDAERVKREAEALELLAAGYGSAFTAAELSRRHGVSHRQARRYVAAAAFELCDPVLSPHSLDSAAMLTLHRLDMIAGQAMAGDDPDHDLAVKASRAHAAALAQFRRAISAPVTRFRLPPTVPPPDPEDETIPF